MVLVRLQASVQGQRAGLGFWKMVGLLANVHLQYLLSTQQFTCWYVDHRLGAKLRV